MEKVNLATAEENSAIKKIDIKEEEKRFTLSLRETERLLFARQVLFFIFIFSVFIITLAAYLPDNELIKQMVDLIKIGVLPLITLIVSFYFPQSSKDNKNADS